LPAREPALPVRFISDYPAKATMRMTEQQLVERLKRQHEWRQRWRKPVGMGVMLIGFAIMGCCLWLIGDLRNQVVVADDDQSRAAYVTGFCLGALTGAGIFVGGFISASGAILFSAPYWKERLILRLWDQRSTAE
jgi:hypothetical protein